MEKAVTSVFIHIIISVKNRKSLIPKENLEEVFNHFTGFLRRKGQNPIRVGGVSNHIHLFIGFKPGVTLTTLVRDLKNNSTNFINLQDWMREKFAWQNGYGAFSYSSSQVEQVSDYIKNQADHHKVKTFREEYRAFLQKFGVDYDEKGLPPDIE
jgi:putative transposase